MSRKKVNKGLWIDRFPQWIDKMLSKNPNLDKNDLEFIVQTFFKFVHQKMSNPTLPTIRIKGIGAFKPSLKKVNFSMRQSIKAYRRGIGFREKAIRRIEKFWPIRNRLMAESKGEYTYRDWKQYHNASEGKDKVIYVSNTYTTTKYTDEELLILNGEN